MSNNRVYVGNLAYSVTNDDLKNFMQYAGEVTSVKLLHNASGQSRGCGIVEFASPTSAQNAQNTLQNVDLKGRLVYIREDREPSRPMGDRSNVFKVANPLNSSEQVSKVAAVGGGIPATGGPLSGPVSGSFGSNIGTPLTAGSSIGAVGGPVGGIPAFQRPANRFTSGIPQVGRTTAFHSQAQGFQSQYPQQASSQQHLQSPQVSGNGPREQGSNHYYSSLQQHAPGTAVFVGNLPFTVAWYDLKEMFEQAGEVVCADVHIGRHHRSKGYGTVVFETPEGAQEAIRQFHNFKLEGRALEVREDVPSWQRPGAFLWCSGYGEPSDTVFVTNLPWTTTGTDLQQLFQSIATIVRAQLQVFPDGRLSGNGVVRFENLASAELAIKQLNGYMYGGRSLHVSFARYQLPLVGSEAPVSSESPSASPSAVASNVTPTEDAVEQ